MFTLKRTAEFDAWLSDVQDGVIKARLAARLRKAGLGNLGDVKAIEGHLYEMREHF